MTFSIMHDHATRRRFYERPLAGGLLSATCAISGLIAAAPPSLEHSAEPTTRGPAIANAPTMPMRLLPKDCTLRVSASTSSISIDELRRGALLAIEGQNDEGWLRVRTSSQAVGWTGPACWRQRGR